MHVDGSGLRKLTDDEAKDRNPVWSPDGSQAAFYSNRGGRYEIWTVNRDGSNLRQRTSSGEPTGALGSMLFPIWAPDGQSIAASASNEIVRFSLQDQPVSPAELQTIPIDRGDAAFVVPMSWSPDGRKIAGVRIGHNGQLLGGIVVYDLSTSTTRFLRVDGPVPPAGHVFPTLSWLPDSRRGAVRWGDRALLVNTATGAITTLLAGLNSDGGIMRLSGDGSWLYMLDSRDEGDLWLASQDPALSSSRATSP
jgi:WD40 repeat protein